MWDEGEARKLGAEEKRDQANGMKENARKGRKENTVGVQPKRVENIDKAYNLHAALRAAQQC